MQKSQSEPQQFSPLHPQTPEIDFIRPLGFVHLNVHQYLEYCTSSFVIHVFQTMSVYLPYKL